MSIRMRYCRECVGLVLLVSLSLAGCLTPEGAPNVLQGPLQLDEAQAALQERLNALNGELAQVAQAIPPQGLASPATRALLLRLAEHSEAVVDCCTVDAAGVIVAMEPAAYREVEGKSIADQEQVIRLHATRKPVLSNLFTTVEGFPAVDLEWPMFSEDGAFIGSVSMLIRHTRFFAELLEGPLSDTRWQYWCLQTDGTILYDPDRIEIGRNTFNDTIYHPFPSLISVCKKMVSQPSGKGKYKFYSTGVRSIIPKECYWRTIGLHGVEWRLVASRDLAGHLER